MSKDVTTPAAEEEKAQDTAITETSSTSTTLAEQNTAPMGFEDEEAGDLIIPRIKVIQTLSPERKDGIASEGDILNSLTKDRLNGKTFIPVFKFNNNIDWKPRSEGGGIQCSASDGKKGETSDGRQLICASCRRCEFDNTKQGKEALPKCTKYINFFGFLEGEKMPIILSFAKTNYNEGKKLYSLARVTMQNMWNYGYTLNEKLVAKNSNEWYIINTAAHGATSYEDRQLGLQLFQMYRNTIGTLKYDLDEAVGAEESFNPAVSSASTEF